ncbi:MAG: imidazole glycerol phosphate synthase subunit HisH [Acidimicrobiales bacterium]|nr:imidazole glycerol phosphate synthase subunit HisH [Acidimicrobiales bacterium]
MPSGRGANRGWRWHTLHQGNPVSKPLVAVLDYGIGNLRSAQKALIRVGSDARLTSDIGLIAEADGVVLPGVGAFGACMKALHGVGLAGAAVSAAASGRPFIGICVGMQLLYEGSEESPGIAGLGVLPGQITRLPSTVKRPQMQWNRLDLIEPDHPSVAGLGTPWLYFVHSYRAPVDHTTVATVDYGDAVTAVTARDNVWATQCHPEKSSVAGLELLKNWVKTLAPATAETSTR